MLLLAAGVLPEFDPPTVIDAASAAGWDGVGALPERFGELCDLAAPAGITVTVEFGRIFGAAVDSKHITYAQLCDAPAVPRDTSAVGLRTDAVDDRCNLGEGGLWWRQFVDALPASTPLSLEIRSAALRSNHPDPVDRAREILRATRAALD